MPSGALLTSRQHQMLASLTGRLMFLSACRGGRQSRAVARGRGTSEGAGCGGGARHRRGRAHRGGRGGQAAGAAGGAERRGAAAHIQVSGKAAKSGKSCIGRGNAMAIGSHCVHVLISRLPIFGSASGWSRWQPGPQELCGCSRRTGSHSAGRLANLIAQVARLWGGVPGVQPAHAGQRRRRRVPGHQPPRRHLLHGRCGAEQASPSQHASFWGIMTELPAQCDGMASNVQFNSHAGMRLIQLLPVNDTSVNMMWWDSYPYSSLSVGLPCSALLVLPHLSP